jgi:hypothetical protein
MIHGWKHRYKLLKSIGEGLKVTPYAVEQQPDSLAGSEETVPFALSRCLGSLHVLLGGNKRLNTLIR